jgi:hypothetical protein
MQVIEAQRSEFWRDYRPDQADRARPSGAAAGRVADGLRSPLRVASAATRRSRQSSTASLAQRIIWEFAARAHQDVVDYVIGRSDLRATAMPTELDQF